MSLSKEQVVKQFVAALQETRNLYVKAGLRIVGQYPHLVPDHEQDFVAMMDDLHKGLLVKLFVSISDSDLRFSREETWLLNLLWHHIWRQSLESATLPDLLARVRQDAAALRWYSLIRPFDELPPLREQIGDLETLIFRMANLIAKADGEASSSELQVIDKIQRRVAGLLHGVGGANSKASSNATSPKSATISAIAAESRQVRQSCELDDVEPLDIPEDEPDAPQVKIEQALAELDKLIGLAPVKQEVRTLINFLELQRKRQELGLPATPLSLHLVFKGNPGTGKTTIARILGQVYGAMNILKRGHLIETDRSGLVAQYAGQTGPKANAKIDEALDGILFIDEAYGLIAEKGDDPFGAEAIQTLLKRMEDDRERLVVILAGYPDEMDRLLKSNPGLSSRFSHILQFDDYSPRDLGQIFGTLCERNHYELDRDAQGKLMVGLNWLHAQRDRHFGNGRTVRNLFEHAIRRLANRVAKQAEISRDTLIRFTADDIELLEVPAEEFFEDNMKRQKFGVACEACHRELRFGLRKVGRRVKCPGCGKSLSTAWPVPSA